MIKKRYILGEGYPWGIGSEPHRSIGLKNSFCGGGLLELDFSEELWKDESKFRLVLEEV